MYPTIGFPSVLRGALGRPLDEFGTVDIYGEKDTTGIINDALAITAEAGDPLLIGVGNYKNSSSIYLPSGAQVIATNRTTFTRYFSTLGTGAHVTQEDIYTPISNARWIGGRLECSDASTLTGNVFCLNFTDSEMADFRIGDWPDNGRAFLLYGARVRIHDFEALSQYDGGGVRLDGCQDFIVSNFRVYCGDDCLMFATNQTAASALANQNTERCQYVNGTARSWNGRPCVSTVERVGIEDLVAAYVQDNAFIGIRGYGRRATRVNNTLTTGAVRRIYHIGCHYDCSDDTVGGAAAVSVTADTIAGGVSDIVFTDCTILSPYLSTVDVFGAARRVRFSGCTFGAPRTARETVRVDDQADALFENCVIYVRDDMNGVRVGASADDCRAWFRGGEIHGIDDALNGLNFIACAAGEVSDMRFFEADGATTASAVVVQSGCNNVLIGRNDYSDITDSVKVAWTPADNSGCMVDTSDVQTISTNTTARPHTSGTTYVQTSAGSRTLTLPTAATGLEYTFIQSGSGAAVASAVGSDIIRVPGGASTGGGTITSGAQGDFVRLRGISGAWLAVAIGGTWTPA